MASSSLVCCAASECGPAGACASRYEQTRLPCDTARRVLDWADDQAVAAPGPVPPVVGPLGVPADPAGQGPGAGLKGAIRRWRAQRQLRRTELRETKVIARENLRDLRDPQVARVAHPACNRPARHGQ
jgi:hypothetical protein